MEKTSTDSGGIERGRQAKTPGDIPKRGWIDILKRTKNQIGKDNIGIIAAGVAFYSLLSLPFLLSAVVSIYGLIADPIQIQEQLSGLQGMLPGEAYSLIADQLTRISSQSSDALTFALAGSILLALWSGSRATKALIISLNIAHEESEKRGFFKLNFMAIFLTLFGVIGAVLAVALVVVVPPLIGMLGLSGVAEILTNYLRWPILVGMALVGLAVLYKFGPSREHARLQWMSWGAVAATTLWIVSSALFSWYISNFGTYNETYGSLGAVVITLMWAYLSAYMVILGAELNAEMEHQTRTDSTTGKPRPMGERGARMADTLGEAQDQKIKKKRTA